MIGRRWKCGNAWSLTILIGRGLDFKTETKRSDEIFLFSVQLSGCARLTITDTFSGGNGEGVPPVPIPNTEVKPFSADGTWLDTARESRSPPDSNRVVLPPTCLNSSMAEHSAVNRRVVGSSPS